MEKSVQLDSVSLYLALALNLKHALCACWAFQAKAQTKGEAAAQVKQAKQALLCCAGVCVLTNSTAASFLGAELLNEKLFCNATKTTRLLSTLMLLLPTLTYSVGNNIGGRASRAREPSRRQRNR